jgi:hypothetical protein
VEPRAPLRSTMLALLAWLAFAVAPGLAAAQAPQPDAAPGGHAVAPDPVPGVAETAPPQQQTSSPAAPTSSPRPVVTKVAAAIGPRRSQSERPSKRHARQARAAATRPAGLLRIDALLPRGGTSQDSGSPLLLIAAGALLALVLASGSLVSVGTRAMKGQLR